MFQTLARSLILRLTNLVRGSRKGIEDVSVSFLAQIVQVATGMLSSILLARGLGAEVLGDFALVGSISGLVLGLSDLGVSGTATRFAAGAAAAGDIPGLFAFLRWSFRIRLTLAALMCSLVLAAAGLVAGHVWHTPGLANPMRYHLLFAVFSILALTPGQYFQTVRRFRAVALLVISQSLVNAAAIIAQAVLGWWSLQTVVFANIVAAAINATVALSIAPRDSYRAPSGNQRGLAEFWRKPSATIKNLMGHEQNPGHFALYMAGSTAMVMITQRIDLWLMGTLLTKADIGVYNVAGRFPLPLALLLGAINAALWPRVAAQRDWTGTLSLLLRTFRISIVVALAAGVYAILAPRLAPLIFGGQYRHSTVLAQLLCARYCVSILICPIGIIGYNLGLERIYLIINFIQLVVVTAINVVAMPRVGAMGAALALIGNEIVGGGITILVLVMRVRKIAPPKDSERRAS